MASKPRRKLILPTLLILTLLLCALTTISLTLIRGNRPVALWIGNSVYAFHSRSESSSFFYGETSDMEGITLGSPPRPHPNCTMSSNDQLRLFDNVMLTVWKCNP